MGSPPFVLGFDVAGDVVGTGAQVAAVEVGERVAGMVNFPSPAGAYAEYVVAPAQEVVAIPETVTYAQAAAVPLAGLTAYQALFDIGEAQSGKRVLIHAAAGGVGHLAVQLAAAAGCRVIGSASERNRDYLLGVGASEVIDYRDPDWEGKIDAVDLVIDPIGGTTRDRSLAVLAETGTLVGLTSDAKSSPSSRVRWMLVAPESSELADLIDRLSSGGLTPTVTTLTGLHAIAEAHSLSEGKHTRGKLVVELG